MRRTLPARGILVAVSQRRVDGPVRLPVLPTTHDNNTQQTAAQQPLQSAVGEALVISVLRSHAQLVDDSARRGWNYGVGVQQTCANRRSRLRPVNSASSLTGHVSTSFAVSAAEVVFAEGVRQDKVDTVLWISECGIIFFLGEEE